MVQIDFIGVYDFFLRLISFFDALITAVTGNIPNAFVTIGSYFYDVGATSVSRFFYQIEDIATPIVEAIGDFLPIIETLYNDISIIEGYMYLCIGVVVLLGFLKLLGDILPT